MSAATNPVCPQEIRRAQMAYGRAGMNLTARGLPRGITSHSSLATGHCISNRYTSRLDRPLTHSKQTSLVLSNRYKFDGWPFAKIEQEAKKTPWPPVACRPARQICGEPWPPKRVSPRRRLIATRWHSEIVVTNSKLKDIPFSNRDSNAPSLPLCLPASMPPSPSQSLPRPCVTIAAKMSKLRISVVEYLNTAPLVWGFVDGPLQGKYDLSFTVPSQCAEALRRGDADVAIIPAIEYQRIENIVALPGMSVAAKGEVRSILVVAKKPIDMAKKIALDSSSRSSAALVRLLAKDLWNISPEFVEASPDPSEMLKQADAALVIGDPALHVSLKMEALAGRAPSGEQCCQGDPDDMPVPGFETLFVYDVAYQWEEMTGKPCVLAIWAGRRDAITAEVLADFQASKQYGLERAREIAEAASIKLDLPPKALYRYLTENINFDLDEENLAGLNLFFERAAVAGLIPRVRPLEFMGQPAKANAHRGA
jgi:chorismate dehydratase